MKCVFYFKSEIAYKVVKSRVLCNILTRLTPCYLPMSHPPEVGWNMVQVLQKGIHITLVGEVDGLSRGLHFC